MRLIVHADCHSMNIVPYTLTLKHPELKVFNIVFHFGFNQEPIK